MMVIKTEELRKSAATLCAGDRIALTGYIYTARDAAHKRLCEIITEGQILPIDLLDSILYYAGPTEPPFNMPIGSCGPTTSGRMDKFTPLLLDHGVAATIGKGERSGEVVESIIKNSAPYFAAIGGAGALAADCIKSAETVAFPEFGCESINRIYIENFPLITAIDIRGKSVYTEGKKRYATNVGQPCKHI